MLGNEHLMSYECLLNTGCFKSHTRFYTVKKSMDIVQLTLFYFLIYSYHFIFIHLFLSFYFLIYWQEKARTTEEDLEGASGRGDREDWFEKKEDALRRDKWRDGVREIAEGMG